MKVTVVCSNPEHPVNAYLQKWVERHSRNHEIELIQKKSELSGGDLLFLISCSEIITAQDRTRYGISLVLHASDLPKGRGWSPYIWEIAAGASHITLCLLEALDKVDTGRVWKKMQIAIPSDFLCNEINHLLFNAEIELMDFALSSYRTIQPQEQSADVLPTYYRMRTPQDSRIDPQKTIAEQFDLMRVADPTRFPTFFEYRGHRYTIKLEKVNDE
jgi:methionyl-tRNA formyltransferase